MNMKILNNEWKSKSSYTLFYYASIKGRIKCASEAGTWERRLPAVWYLSVAHLSVISNPRKKTKQKTLLSIQASALGTITVRVVMRTVVSECGEMVLSQSVFKKRKTTPFLFGNMD